MKKLILVFMVIGSVAYAKEDCSVGAQKVVDNLAAHNLTSVTIDYSADKAKEASVCKEAIMAKNSTITVNLNQVKGTDKFEAHGK